MTDDTIFAVSSGAGVAGVAVVRISGAAADAALAALAGPVLPRPRYAALRTLRAPGSDAVLDRALCLRFPRPHSFTGEGVAELHLHGGYGVVAGVLAALGEMPGLRPAEPGEFSRRAFENGKLDLLQVEALGDLIAARTGEQVRLALGQDERSLSRRCVTWRHELIGVLARLEAAIDFVDEDLPAVETRALQGQVEGVRKEVIAVLKTARKGQAIRQGYQVAILGAPNVGKSSLLNRLSGLDAAIVAEEAGTTRDVIQVDMDMGGLMVRLCDTAGLREGAGPVEAQGMARAVALAGSCDLAVVVHEATVGVVAVPGLPAEMERLDVINKVDLTGGGNGAALGISALMGTGVDVLLDEIAARLRADVGAGEPVLVSRGRQVAGLQAMVDALGTADWRGPAELICEDVRQGLGAIDSLTGVVGAEETLDVVFKEFCIGK